MKIKTIIATGLASLVLFASPAMASDAVFGDIPPARAGVTNVTNVNNFGQAFCLSHTTDLKIDSCLPVYKKSSKVRAFFVGAGWCLSYSGQNKDTGLWETSRDKQGPLWTLIDPQYKNYSVYLGKPANNGTACSYNAPSAR